MIVLVLVPLLFRVIGLLILMYLLTVLYLTVQIVLGEIIRVALVARVIGRAIEIDIIVVLVMSIEGIGMTINHQNLQLMIAVSLVEIMVTMIIVNLINHIMMTSTGLISPTLIVMLTGIRGLVLLLLTVLNGKVRRKGPKRMFI